MMTARNLADFFADTAFICCDGIHRSNGITDANEQEAEVRKIDDRTWQNVASSLPTTRNSICLLFLHRPVLAIRLHYFRPRHLGRMGAFLCRAWHSIRWPDFPHNPSRFPDT